MFYGIMTIYEGGDFMQSAAYGKYKNGKIYFDDPVPAISESKVIVVFLDKEQKKPDLMDIFNIYGKWEDDRDTDTIINEIYNSRVSSKDIQL